MAINGSSKYMNPIVYIEADTKVDILKGVPLPQNYSHVCSFPSIQATYAAFQPYIKYSMVNATPVKIPNAVRVNYGFKDLSDCNYLIFSNYSAGSHLIYAFITDMVYVNYSTTEIHYKIDIWTTNYAKAEFGRCYVEREHVSNDAFGLHTIPEGLETGTYVNNKLKSLDYDMDYTCILHTPKATDAVKGYMVNGIYSGLIPTIVTTKSAPTIEAAIADITENYSYPETILAIFHYPSFMGFDNIGSQFTDVLMPTDLDGYVPKNNKCFTSEFCYVLADDLAGSTHEYAFENSQSEGHAITFRSCGTFMTQPVINTYPIQYKGMANAYMEGITTNNFPQCSWSSDVFAAWYAQNRSLLSAQATGSVLGILSGGIMGAINGFARGGPAGAETGAALGVAGGATNALSSAITRAAQIETKQRQPSQANGQIMLDSLNIADNRTHINFYTMTVKNEIAQMIDGFFETFGYKVNTLKVPNITGRPYWNFVKCSNAVINGDLYMETTGEMETILNNGVTVWHSLGNIGNYNLNNH